MAAKQKTPKKANIDLDNEEEITDIMDTGQKNYGKEKKPPKEKKVKEKKPKREGKRGGAGILPALIALVVLGGVGAALYFDAMGARTKYVFPALRNVPLVKNIIPPETTTAPADPLAALSNEELIAQIKALETKVTATEKEKDEALQKAELYSKEIENLQKFEASQQEYDAKKAQFDELIALNDPAAYATFYESIDPEGAKMLYRLAVSEAANVKDFKKYYSTLQAVDDTEAAKIITELAKTDMPLVVTIFKNIDSELGGSILSNMLPKDAAKVVKRMTPVAQTPPPAQAQPTRTP